MATMHVGANADPHRASFSPKQSTSSLRRGVRTHGRARCEAHDPLRLSRQCEIIDLDVNPVPALRVRE